MLSGRCEQTIGNNPGEIEAITAAARSFLKSELEVSSLLLPSLEFQLAARPRATARPRGCRRRLAGPS